MAAEEFHLFPLLPGELRDLIWDHSVRPPGVRGVQYFSIFPAKEVPKSFRRHVLPPAYKDEGEVIGPPMPETPGSPPSWNRNRSTYTIDGGLWNACKESRAAMHRRHDSERWKAVCDDQYLSSDKELSYIQWLRKYSNVPATFSVDTDGGLRCFTLLPSQDLIFIQGNLSTLNWNLLSYEMPFSRYLGLGVGFSHIATEFDPSWTIKELHQYEDEKRCPQGTGWDGCIPDDRFYAYHELVVAANCKYDSENTTLWLVDHRLRRKATETQSPNQKSKCGGFEQMVFQGDGCKYYAVPSWACDQLCEYDADTASQRDFLAVWDFAEAVRMVVLQSGPWRHGYHEEDEIPTPFNFLICEKDD